MIPELLTEYGVLIRDRMQNYLPRGEPADTLYDLIADYPSRGGKMMRPTICIASARAFGAEIDEAILSAVSIELFHNALLIHDDIEDESDDRRGSPTLHELHGIPLALNAGSTLGLISMRPLLDNREIIGPHTAMRILEEIDRVAIESAEGQAMDIGWRIQNRMDLGNEDYLLMVLKKTCWLATIYPCRVGAIIAGASTQVQDALVRFGFFLGAAFQIQDDLLNFVADPSYGKEYCGDLYEGKRTLMLIHLFESATPQEKTELKEIFSGNRQTRSAQQIDKIMALMEHYGSIEYARAYAFGLAGAAQHEFDQLSGVLRPGRDKEFLQGLSTWVFERT